MPRTEAPQDGEPRQSGFITELSRYSGLSPRLLGLVELQTVGAKTTDPLVIEDQTFRDWKENGGEFSTEALSFLKLAYHQINNRSEGKGVHIGRGAFVPGVEKPEGPRSADIKNENDFIAEVEKHYLFVTGQEQGKEHINYDIEGAEIALLTHPFINALIPPLEDEPLKPYPGGAAFLRSDGRVEIHAGFGQDEVVQGRSHDVYIAEHQGTQRKFITSLKVDVRQKKFATVVKDGEYDDKFPLDESIQWDRTLREAQIVQIRNVMYDLNRRYGPRRVEFMIQPDGIVFRECLPEDRLPEKTPKTFDITGEVLVVQNQSREELAGILSRHKGKDLIVYLHEEVSKARLDILPSLGNDAIQKGVKLVVLAYGTGGITGHRIKNLTDLGIEVKFIGEEDVINNGETVRVYTEEGYVRYEKEDPMTEIGLVTDDKARFGGKAVGLKKLLEAGFTIPEGFVMETSIFRKHLENAKVSKRRLKRLERLLRKDLSKERNSKRFTNELQEIRDRVYHTSLSPETLAQVEKMLSLFPDKFVSLRSSATCEDARGSTFAGLFDSETQVDRLNPRDVELSILKIFASVFEEDVFKTAKNFGVDSQTIQMALVCHERIEAKKQGVIHTNQDDQLLIEVGIGEEAVQGQARETIYISRVDGDSDAKKIRKLTKRELSGLKRLGLEIEEALGEPQDLEWAITPGNKIIFLQARPRVVNGHS